jgi:AcrR family transcriptional regulator
MARKSKAYVRKREILEHFYQVIRDGGLEGASIAKIAKHMGVHPSLLIHYFSTKEEMVVELVGYMLERYEETYLAKVVKIKDPNKRLDALMNTLFSKDWIKLIDDTVFYACYYLSFKNERIRNRFRVMYDNFREILRNEIKMYMKQGIVNVTDVENAVNVIIALAEGIDFYGNVYGEDRYSENFSQYVKGLVLNFLKTGMGTI